MLMIVLMQARCKDSSAGKDLSFSSKFKITGSAAVLRQPDQSMPEIPNCAYKYGMVYIFYGRYFSQIDHLLKLISQCPLHVAKGFRYLTTKQQAMDLPFNQDIIQRTGQYAACRMKCLLACFIALLGPFSNLL